MIIGVVSNFVAFVHNSADELRITFRIFSNEEKRRFHVGCFQNVEHLRRPFRIGSVVKRDRDLMFAARALVIKRRKLRETGYISR